MPARFDLPGKWWLWQSGRGGNGDCTDDPPEGLAGKFAGGGRANEATPPGEAPC